MAVLISKVVRSSSAERVDEWYSSGNNTANRTHLTNRTAVPPATIPLEDDVFRGSARMDTNIEGKKSDDLIWSTHYGDRDKRDGIVKTVMTVVRHESCEIVTPTLFLGKVGRIVGFGDLAFMLGGWSGTKKPDGRAMPGVPLSWSFYLRDWNIKFVLRAYYMISFVSAGFVLLGVAAAAGCRATNIKDTGLTSTYITPVQDTNEVPLYNQFTSESQDRYVIGYSSVNNRGQGAYVRLNNPTDTTIFIQIVCSNGATYWADCSPYTDGARFDLSFGNKGKCTDVAGMSWRSY
ncbi:restless-like transposase [Macrophomina phaseolina MS6]|uniref:Restless-like transposase n=1 Tax=Macrophomina phaseolina (strain MS6) TaxID=1126212 RepID=K2RXP2_MACPH|nr:restless-like transposase [Macrophomina phaseolina MS6]